MGKGDEGLKIRLQCWDCPGQQEYALLNLLYFTQGIYVVVCDMSEEQRDQATGLHNYIPVSLRAEVSIAYRRTSPEESPTPSGASALPFLFVFVFPKACEGFFRMRRSIKGLRTVT